MSELFIVKVRHVTEHKLEIEFNDSHVSIVDFAPFIFGRDDIFGSGHPDYDVYKDISRFLSFKLVDGNLNWDDYRMIFYIETLYDNKW
jgi:hypothetical protein